MLHFAERLIFGRRFITQRAWKEARNGIDDQHRRKFSPTKHIVPDGYFLRSEMIGDAFVDSLISSAKKNKAVDLRVPSRGLLPKEFPRRRHQNNSRLRSEHSRLLRASQVVAENRFGRLEQRLGLEHHALAAAKRPIIDAAVAILGEYTQILHLDFDQARLASPPQNAVIQGPGKKFRKNGNQIEAHRSC
jgi:hypothetical protein